MRIGQTIKNNQVSAMTSEAAIEAEIQAKGLNAPRLSPSQIDATIDSEHYFTALEGVDGHYRGGTEAQGVQNAQALSLMTFCVLVLKNGFTVTGQSACASPENYDAEIGRKVAREKAREKIWALEGYLLRQRLHDRNRADVAVEGLKP